MSAAKDRLRFTYPDEMPQLRLPRFGDALLCVRGGGYGRADVYCDAASRLVDRSRVHTFVSFKGGMEDFLRRDPIGSALLQTRINALLLVVEASATYDRGTDCFGGIDMILHGIADRVSAARTLPVIAVDMDIAHTVSASGPEFGDPEGPAKVVSRAEREGISVIKTRAATLQNDITRTCEYIRKCSI